MLVFHFAVFLASKEYYTNIYYMVRRKIWHNTFPEVSSRTRRVRDDSLVICTDVVFVVLHEPWLRGWGHRDSRWKYSRAKTTTKFSSKTSLFKAIKWLELEMEWITLWKSTNRGQQHPNYNHITRWEHTQCCQICFSIITKCFCVFSYDFCFTECERRWQPCLEIKTLPQAGLL